MRKVRFDGMGVRLLYSVRWNEMMIMCFPLVVKALQYRLMYHIVGQGSENRAKPSRLTRL